MGQRAVLPSKEVLLGTLEALAPQLRSRQQGGDIMFCWTDPPSHIMAKTLPLARLQTGSFRRLFDEACPWVPSLAS